MLETAIDQFLAQSSFELIAALCALAYLVLALRQNIWCWPFALVSTALYTWVFFDALLLMDSLLNIYYMVMAVYGFWRWRFGHPRRREIKNQYLVLAQSLHCRRFNYWIKCCQWLFIKKHRRRVALP